MAVALFLPVIIATMNTSYALSNSATQTLQATLGTYLDITAQTQGATTTTTIAPDTGNLAAPLVSKFKITLNTDEQDLYLQGNTTSSTGSVNALFQQGGKTYVVFSNTTSGKVPTQAAIADCKTASPTASNNANAIAYQITDISVDNSGSSSYNNSQNQYILNVNAGVTTVITKAGTAPYTNTYSFQDYAGTYQAVMTLTSASL